MKQAKFTDDTSQKMWNECSLLCAFISKHHASISKETELEISKRILLLIEKAVGQYSTPEPF